MPQDPPRLVFWETTEACNLACVHCRRLEANLRPAPDQLTTEEACSLIDQVAEAGCMILVFSGGEPLMRDDIFDLLDRARGAGLHLALATNGTLIDDRMAARIAQAGVRRVSVSLDGADAATHDAFRRIEGSFEAALRGIAHLRAHDLPVQINTTIGQHNHRQLDRLYDLALRVGAEALHLFMLVPVGCGMQLGEDQMLSARRYEEILNWLYDRDIADPEAQPHTGCPERRLRVKATCAPHYLRVWLQRRKAAGLPLQRKGRGWYHMTRGCLAGTEIVFVSHRGDVFPCGYLPQRAGNIRETAFAEIWQDSPVLEQFREPVELSGKCGLCEFRKICLGCRARAYAVSGDALAEEPSCEYVPKRLTPEDALDVL